MRGTLSAAAIEARSTADRLRCPLGTEVILEGIGAVEARGEKTERHAVALVGRASDALLDVVLGLDLVALRRQLVARRGEIGLQFGIWGRASGEGPLGSRASRRRHMSSARRFLNRIFD